jgi:hypothetical protein
MILDKNTINISLDANIRNVRGRDVYMEGKFVMGKGRGQNRTATQLLTVIPRENGTTPQLLPVRSRENGTVLLFDPESKVLVKGDPREWE